MCIATIKIKIDGIALEKRATAEELDTLVLKLKAVIPTAKITVDYDLFD